MTAIIVLSLFAGGSSPAQQSPHERHSQAGSVPLEILQRPVTLRTGIGELHEKVSTHSPEAQSFYDQGIAYVHSYVWMEAARSFHQALRLDPNLAMAYLGLTDAFIGLQDVATASATLERANALEESALYARMAPAIPHAHHMHGHALMRTGRTEEAITEFLKTKELEENYYRSEKIPARYDWHHAHNLTLLAMSYQSLGQMKSAEALFHEAFSSPAYTDFLEYNRKCWPEFLLSRRRYQEALLAARELTQSAWPLARLAGHTLAGQALLGAGSVAEAKEELTLAERETERLPARAVAALPYPTTLRTDILLQEKNTAEGEPLTMDVATSVLAMPGPDAWMAAVFELESMAQSARNAGDWELASFLAQQMILHNLNYAGGHFAYGLAAEHSGKSSEARQAFATAEKLWVKADRDLPELEQIHKQLAALR